MVNTLKLLVGIDSFEKIRRNGFYYIDKTNLIEQILMNWGEVSSDISRAQRGGGSDICGCSARFLSMKWFL